ncbi:fasciclin domain-containing protein [Aurantimonas sp. VKM B-3413]|uniref:fasciclin domain-containing protein n=1 Tax=Aurantimonas sp. VKM B-3413 TaxID=2779401 RepID=UPI001E4F1458|nr:fasciclin domain-containing protein [Aurantimonas sp. VKM B-3413]MCB8837324.1 fasciclin domain-containing protein [Aurantimonas sp. VKM B-3413]
MIHTLIRTTAVAALVAAGSLAIAPATYAQDNSNMSSDMPMVGGAPMDPQKTIVENASEAKNLTTLVAAVKAAGLVDTLSGPGPFTVFAPTNEAFDALPDGTVDNLLKPENKDQLVKILTYHVVPAKATSEAAMQMIKDDGGKHNVQTVSGDTLTLQMNGDKLEVFDESGHAATVTQADVMQSNGVVHVIDKVLMPK